MNKNGKEIVSNNYADVEENKINSIYLSLVTDEDVQSWTKGEVTKPETINYKSYKPERHGLFDELIFGPVTDYKCPLCGKKYKSSSNGAFCTNTEVCKNEKVEILSKSSRRSRMGHIKLHKPVVHFWFFKVDNNIISKLLALRAEGTSKIYSKIDIESIIYYKSHIVVESGGLKSLPKHKIIDINDAAIIYNDALNELKERYATGKKEHEEIFEEITEAIEELKEKATGSIGKDYGIDFYELNEIIEEYSDARIKTGSDAFEYLLKNFDLNAEQEDVKKQINEINASILKNDKTPSSSKILERDKLYKRLSIINSFIYSKQKPESLLINYLPVIPADLRPLIQLNGGRHSTSDINELYRRIIIRNNRLKKWLETDAPQLIVQNELRMIQEAVDSLIDNQRRTPSPVTSKDNRPLKSISDALTGKKGRFRQNLLGKRVDYSGRSVIVVGPSLEMYQAGIPRQMAVKLFEPWIIKELVEKEKAPSIKAAKKMIEDQNPEIWPHVEKVIEGKPVLLNRAPTLHRLSIQAFEPVLIRGKAIRLHPLVTTAFNADFDGDQMAVHVPINEKAVREAQELLMANRNILGPKDGEPIINPSQDMILGLFYLTMEKENAKGEGKFFRDFDEAFKAYQTKVVDLHARVAIPYSKIKDFKDYEIASDMDGYALTTVGKLIFNNAFPNNFPYVFDKNISNLSSKNVVISKYFAPKGSNIKEAIKKLPINDAFSKKDIAKFISSIFERYSTILSISQISTIIATINRDNISDLQEAYAKLFDEKDTLSKLRHAQILATYTKEEFDNIDNKFNLSKDNKIWTNEHRALLLKKVWFRYNNIIGSFLDKIKTLGFEFSTKSGITFSIFDIVTSQAKIEYIAKGDEKIKFLKEKFNEGFITDDERYSLSVKEWTEIKEKVQDDLDRLVKENPDNSISIMMQSGARGSISNFVQLAGLRGLMANNIKTLKADAENERVVRSTVEVPVKSSFLDGITAYEFYSSTHGARKGLTDTALNTARSGYLTRRLVDVAQNIVVKEDDCGSDDGMVAKDIVDTKTNSIIVPLFERIDGRFSNTDIVDKNGELIVPSNTLITKELAEKIVYDEKLTEVRIRSILGCHTRNGVCRKCYGKDLATNKVVAIGEAVGIIAAQSIGEPGTQLTMRTFHTGGVAGVEDITGGFGRLIELIDAYEKPWGKPARISKWNGEIKEIIIKPDEYEIKIEEVETGKINSIDVSRERKLRESIKEGEFIKKGQKITEGPIILKDLLKYSDAREVQKYLLKEIQRLYRLQGISISDKYIEIIIRQMLSKVVIQDAGDSNLFVGSTVDIFEYQQRNGKLLAEGKTPAYGEVIIKGAKQVPLLSDSFLAAASYQETAKILVYSSISKKVDELQGLKENIIVGHKIPAGTNSNYEKDSKYDIQQFASYFKSDEPNVENISEEFDHMLSQYSK